VKKPSALQEGRLLPVKIERMMLMRPRIAIIIIVLLLAAASIVAWLHGWASHIASGAPAAGNDARLLVLIASGLAIISLGVMVAARKQRKL